MESLEQILRCHAGKYPLMEPKDAVKLIYQNVFGGGHLIRDPEACLDALCREYAQTPRAPESAFLEDIGNGMVRVMLSGLEVSGCSVERLGQVFLCSAGIHRGSLEEFLGKLEIRHFTKCSGICEYTCDSGYSRKLRRYKINLTILCTASAFKVTVEGSE